MERHQGKTVSGGSMIEKDPKRECTYTVTSQGKLSSQKHADRRCISSLQGQPNRAFLLRTLACRNLHHDTHVDKTYVSSRPGRMPPTIYTTSPYGHTGRPEAFEANLRPKSSARSHTELEQRQQAPPLCPSKSAPPIATSDSLLLQIPKPQYLAAERTEKEAQTSPKSESAQKGNAGVENSNKVTVNECVDGYRVNNEESSDAGQLRLFDNTTLNEKTPVPYIGPAVEDDKAFTGTFSSYVRHSKDSDNDRNKLELSPKTIALSRDAHGDRIPSRACVRWANEQKTASGKCEKVLPKVYDSSGFRGDRREVNSGLYRYRGDVDTYNRDPLRKILKQHDFRGSNEVRCRSTKTRQSGLIQRIIRCITGETTRERNPVEVSQSSTEPISQKEWPPGSLSQTTDTDCDSNQNKTDETDNTVRDTLETFSRVRVPADNKRDHNVIRARFYSNQKQINAIKTRLVTLSRQQLTGAKNAKEEFCQIHESLTALAKKIELMSTTLAEQNTMVQELNKVVQDLPSKITPITRHPSSITRPQFGARKPSSDQHLGVRTKNYSGIQVRSRSVARCDQINATSSGERQEKHPNFMRRSSSTNLPTPGKVFRLAEEPDASRRACSVAKHEDDMLIFDAAPRQSSDVSSPTNEDLPRPVSQIGRQSSTSKLLKKIKSPRKFTPNEQDVNQKAQPSKPISEVEESVFDINPTDLVSSSPSSRCSSPPTLPTMIEGPNSKSINEPPQGLQRYYRIAYVDSESATQSRVGHKLAATAPTGSRSTEFGTGGIKSPDAPKATEILIPRNFVNPNHAKETISNLSKEQPVKERLTVNPGSRLNYSGRSVCRKSHNGNASGDAYSLRKKKSLNQVPTNSHNGTPHTVVGGSGDASMENTRYQHRSNRTTTRKLSPVLNNSTITANSKRVWRSDSTARPNCSNKNICSSISEQSNLPETQIQWTQFGTQQIYPSANSSGHFGLRCSSYENHNVGFSKKSPADAAGKTVHRWPSRIGDSNNNCAESSDLGPTYLADGTSSKCTNNSQKNDRQRLDIERRKQADTFHFLMAPLPDHCKAAQLSAGQIKPTVYALPEPDNVPTTSYTTQKLQAGRDARRTEAEKKWCEELKKLGVRKSEQEREAPAGEIPSNFGDQKFQELDERSDTKDPDGAKEETCKVATMSVDYKERRRERLESKVQEDLKAILAMTEHAVAERRTWSSKYGLQEAKRDEKRVESSSKIEATASQEVSTSDQPPSLSISTAGTVTPNGEDKAIEVDAYSFMPSSKLEEKTTKQAIPSVSVNIKENSSEDTVPPFTYPFVQPCNTEPYPFSHYIPLSHTISMSSKASRDPHHHCVPFACAPRCCCFNQINPVFYSPNQPCCCDRIKVQHTCEKCGARSLSRRQRSPYSSSSSSENSESNDSSCSSSETSSVSSSSSTSSSSYSGSATPKLRRPCASYLPHPTCAREDSITMYQTAQNSHHTSTHHVGSALSNPVTVYGEHGRICTHGSYEQLVFAHPVTQGVSINQECSQKNAWTTHGRTTLFRRCNASTRYPTR
ncbi:hypothetical protein T265_02566 [Opisthorchis viverrini]|uniref:Uncharacterized protein n=1 Tax=Opisthorchis viverrini TaxID=6198 RepID=A0A075AI69_OPIVI|nr:hypothetical protein T265_02566 [Opisthorchis viverrini]KER31114.1 hypothetical protein T265_02566 [Opisthorchis viverrini]